MASGSTRPARSRAAVTRRRAGRIKHSARWMLASETLASEMSEPRPLRASLEPDTLVPLNYLHPWSRFNDAKTLFLVPFDAGSSLFGPRRICRRSGSAKNFFDGQREALV